MACVGVGEGFVSDDSASDRVQSRVACSADIDYTGSYLLLRRRRVCGIIRQHVLRASDLHLIVALCSLRR